MAKKVTPQYGATIEIAMTDVIIEANPRTAVNEEQLQELANSMKTAGLINPITIAIEQSKYRLITGQRRYLAARLNKWQTIFARPLLNATPELIKEIQLIENCQRADVHELDEAYYFKELGLPASEIALRIGKSMQYVYDRLHLLRLSDRAQELFKNNTIGLRQALQLVKVESHDKQDDLIDELINFDEEGNPVTVQSTQQFKHLISRRVSAHLSSAIFDTNYKKLTEAMPCAKCPKRSGFNKNLFNDIESDDICFDRTCFEEKTMAYLSFLETRISACGATVVRLSGVMFPTEITEQMKTSPDYNYSLKSILLDDIKDGDVVGLYFEHQTVGRIGSIAKIEAQPEEQEQPKVEHKTAIIRIKEDKARMAFSNSVTQQLAFNIGAHGCLSIPLATIRLLAMNTFAYMPLAEQNDLIRFYSWNDKLTHHGRTKVFSDVPSGAILLFIRETEGKKYEYVCEFLLIALVYDTVKNIKLESPEAKLIFELAKEWKIDIDRLFDKIENDFGINLKNKYQQLQ